MGRSIAGAVVGYIVLALIIMGCYTAAFLGLGPSFAFQSDGSTNVTMGWLMLMVVVSLLAAVAGGYVAAMVGGGSGARAVQFLLVLVLVLGVISAVAEMGKEVPADLNPSQLSNIEAAQYAVQPTWFAFTVPVLGMVGVWFGGLLYRRRLGPA